MKIGDTFLGGLPGKTPHLWVVMTEPDAADEVVIVNLTSNPGDQTCRIHPGEHPFVKEPTWVRYQDAKIRSRSVLERALAKKILKAHQPVSPDLLLRIQQGATQSEFAPGKVIRAVKRLLGLSE